jgi:hypothetical protein
MQVSITHAHYILSELITVSTTPHFAHDGITRHEHRAVRPYPSPMAHLLIRPGIKMHRRDPTVRADALKRADQRPCLTDRKAGPRWVRTPDFPGGRDRRSSIDDAELSANFRDPADDPHRGVLQP